MHTLLHTHIPHILYPFLCWWAFRLLRWRWWNSSWVILNSERWCCESAALNMPANLENAAVATGLEKVSFYSNPRERHCQRMLKLPHNCTSHTLVKWCLKFSKPGFSNTWTVNFQMFKLDLDKAEEPEMKSPRSAGSQRNQESSSKTCTSALLIMPRPLTVLLTINYGKFWKRLEYQTTWPASWEICMQVRKQQLELDMEQQTGSK